MKKIIMSLMAFSIIALVSLNTLAQGKNLKEQVTFNEQIWVNTTTVKPGTYTVEYSAQSGEINILNGKKIVATAKATVTTNEKKFSGDALMTTTTPNGTKLTGIRLGGQREEITITDMTASKESPNQ